MKRAAIPRFIVSNRETIKTLFLDFDNKDNMMVYTMDGLYHQLQRIADTVRRVGRGKERESEKESEKE